MPTVQSEVLTGFAHCEDPLCSGSFQEPVEVVRTTTQYSYRDSGGDLPGTEKSFEHYTFADEVVVACPVCGKPRAASAQERPVYPTSQWAQDGLLKLIRDGMVKPMGEAAQRHDGEIAELKEQLAELRALLATDKPRRTTRPVESKDEEA